MVVLRPIEILLIEDNPGDVRLTREALLDSKILNHLSVVIDGQEAVKFLYKTDEYVEAPTPDLILLDLKLPKLNGLEVLTKIRENDALVKIPVIVLTSSDDVKDIEVTHQLGATYYITKPVVLENFSELIKSVDEFWISFVKLPQ